MTKSSTKIRPLFQEGFDRTSELLSLKEYGNKLCQAFCGCGKSRFAYKAILKSIKLGNSINLIVFPSIALITQFNADYINTYISSGKFKTLSICSKNELDNSEYKEFSYTTKTSDIQSFINKKSHKIICCTYQSLTTLTESLGNTKIQFAIFDEAHRSESTTIRSLIYNDNPFFQLGLFMTATPSPSMKSTMERICYIPYFKALQADYLKPFELRLDIDRKTKTIQDFTIYKSIARAILTTGNNRVMTFHAFSNKNTQTPNYDSDNSESSISSNDSNCVLSLYKTRTSVNTFANKKEFKKAFKLILSSEFPHLKDKYSKITVKGIDASTKNRRKILEKFDQTKDDEVFILASCRTIGEGIDTKKANMCVFADPKSSLKDIIQNIGRILRKCENQITGTVLITALIDFKEYSDCNTLEEKDEVLRNNINTSDDFNGILNVVSALKQDNEEYFDQCLMYPKKYIQDKPKKYNKQKSGKKLEDIIQIDPSIQNRSDDDKLQEYTEKNNNLVILTQEDDMENYETIFGDQTVQNHNQKIINISKKSDNNGGYVYTLGNTKDDHSDEDPEEDSCKKGCRCGECVEKRKQILKDHIKINIHINPEFKVLWKIKDDDIKNLLNSTVIECVVDRDKTYSDSWKQNLSKVKKYIDDNKKRPSQSDKNKDIKVLATWISNQKQNYCKKACIMGTNSEIYDMWTEFINDPKYKKYLQSNEDDWKDTLVTLKKYMDDNKKRPLQTDKKKDITVLGNWIGTQQGNYSQKKHIMTNSEIYDMWTEFINDPKYKKYFQSNEDDWKYTLVKVKKYMDDNKKKPSTRDKNKDIKRLGSWIGTQQGKYSQKKQIMTNTKIYDMWTEFINDPKYKKYLQSNEDVWKDTLVTLKKYIDDNKKRPSKSDKNKVLCQWLCTQQKNYCKKKQIMTNTKIYDMWTAFINDPKYKEYFQSNEDIWKDRLDKVKKYMDDNKKRPSSTDKNKDIKSLGSWIGTQQGNYCKKKEIMKTTEIYDMWTEFINDSKYKEYFRKNPNINTSKRVDVLIINNEETKYTCECGSIIKNNTKNITGHKNTKKHKEYLDKKHDLLCEEGCDCVNCEDEIKEKEYTMEKCVHRWKVMKDDKKYNYKECELCGRKSKEGRLGKEEGYKEPNPEKKNEINDWFTKQEYNNGKAFVLDANGLKTSNKLLDSGKFSSEDIVIPEYDINTYKMNRCDKRLGKSVINGDYLDEMKKCDIEEISLIYADFTGSYNKFVEPLLEYMKDKRGSISVGTVIGLTWSNNGVGTTSVRSKILRKLGKYEIEIGMEEIDGSPTESGYGDGGCMNVIFYRKT